MMIALSEREKKLLDILGDGTDLSIAALGDQLGVSSATIRNDLSQLTEKGCLVRFKGKAIPAFHPDVMERQKQNLEAKKRIARVAADRIESGDTVIIDTGTTAALIPRYLFGKHDVHIVTNSMLLLPYARINPGLRVTIVGGEFRPAIDCLVGRLAIDGFSNFHVRHAFLGTSGFSIKNGVTNQLLESADVIRTMGDCAEEIILVADSSKFRKLGFARVFGLERVNELITDEKLTVEARNELSEFGLKITIA